jgi:cytochrome c oxidase assembly protein subunit 15
MDRQAMAMIHSITGAMFFSLCVFFRLYCSPRWTAWQAKDDRKLSPLGFASVIALPLLIVGQYLLGGMLRHMHVMLNEHIIGAVVVGVSSSAVAIVLLRSNHSLLKSCGILIATSLLLQIALGMGSYITRFGLPSVGYVASAGSLSQAIVCSLHTVVGMFLLASSVCGSVSAIQLFRAGCLLGLNLGEVSLRNRGTVA